ncbi:MAG: hypothetical protein RL063_160, partial [Pseudomonadota bacterium]
MARCERPFAIKNIIGIESNILVRDASIATRRAIAFSASEAGFMPNIFCWFGQINTQTLNNIIVPN